MECKICYFFCAWWRMAEEKFFDTSLSFLFDSTGEVPATGQLALVPTGTTANTRLGRIIRVHKIEIYGRIENDTSIADNLIRLCLVQDTQANGAAANYTDVFQTSTLEALGNKFNEDRFWIIEEWYMAITASTDNAGVYNKALTPFSFCMDVDIPIIYSGTTGAITEIRSNNLFLTSIGLEDDVTAFTGNARLYYNDE